MQPWSRHIRAAHSAVMTYLQALTRRALALVALAALVGHGLAACSTYSGKSTFEMRRDALAKLAYGSDKEKGRHSTDFDIRAPRKIPVSRLDRLESEQFDA